jgi:Gas vesicle synthesis protein GvpO
MRRKPHIRRMRTMARSEPARIAEEGLRTGARIRDTGEERPVTGSEIARIAKECLLEVTGLTPDAVSGIAQDDDGWHVNVDMLQLKRIPAATDVLATYEAVLDNRGNLISYQRTGSYYRGQVTGVS